MNKSQIIMAGIGGVGVIAAGILGYSAFTTFQENQEKASDLDQLIRNVQTIANAKISPTQESIRKIDENRQQLEKWRGEAIEVAKVGDLPPDVSATPESFKRTMTEVARRLCNLPGSEGGKLIKEDFAFGYPEYITRGDLPTPDALPKLQRRWTDMEHLITTLSAAGVKSLDFISFPSGKKIDAAPQIATRAGKEIKKVQAKDLDNAVIETYNLKFTCAPAALVKVLDAFATDKRFIAVDNLEFLRLEDPLGQTLSASAKSEEREQAQKKRAGGRRRRARNADSDEDEEAQNEEAEAAKKAKNSILIDPSTDVPFTVNLTLVTCDFGSKLNPAEESDMESEKTEAAEEAEKKEVAE